MSLIHKMKAVPVLASPSFQRWNQQRRSAPGSFRAALFPDGTYGKCEHMGRHVYNCTVAATKDIFPTHFRSFGNTAVDHAMTQSR